MAPRISLALAIHNHQPVGNFGWVFAEVYQQAYCCRWSRHSSSTPHVRLSLHTPGPLLEWPRPSGRTSSPGSARSSARPRRAARRRPGEPVLASLPEHDRIAQLRLADVVESIAGRRPRGAWLAERVWEPDLPTSLVEAGYRWSILDDAHFRAATIPEEDLWGPYTTEDQGRLLTVFGTEQGLRFRIPFREVGEVIGYLRDHASEAGDRVGMMGDDGEKFGAWPTTYEHCWGRGRWVDRFFEALEMNRDWLTTGHLGLARPPSADRPGLHPDQLIFGDGRMGAARPRGVGLRGRPPPREAERRPRGSLAAWRLLAQLPGQVP